MSIVAKTNPRPADSQDQLNLGRLSGSLGFLLRMAQIEIFESYHSSLGEYGLKPGEFSVIWLISLTPQVRQGVIASNLRIKPAHMTKLIRGLEQRGYVARIIPDNDRRSVLLDLTEKGLEFVANHQEDFFAEYFYSEDGLSHEEILTLVTLLQKFTGFSAEKPQGAA